MRSYCPAEGWGPVSNRRVFDLTPCFEDTILLAIPALIFSGFALVNLWKLNKLPEIPHRKKWLYRLKTILSYSLPLIGAARLVTVLRISQPASISLSLGAQFTALVLLPIVMRRNHLRARRSSSLVLLFWPTYLAALATWARTSYLTSWFDQIKTEIILTISLAVIGTIVWSLECIGPEHGPGAYHPIGKDVHESPFQTANIYSRWTFHWMDALMRLGSKRPLEEEDVYELGPGDQADVLAEKLESAAAKHSSLWAALAAAYGATYAEAAMLKVFQDILAFAQPQFLRMFLAYISYYQASVVDPNTTSAPPSRFLGIKLYAWERFFIAKILQVRNEQELMLLRKIGVTNAIGMMFWGTIPLLVSLASFTAAAYVRAEPLTSDVVFPAISLFLLLSFPLAMFAQITTSIVSAMVSVKRLSKFLNARQLQEAAVLYEEESNALPVLEIKSGDFRWVEESAQASLEGIDLTVGPHDLVAVLGRVGSGKTSLLSAIAGEMHKSDGVVVVRGSVAYCPQNPWIMSATVRDNILFCHEYEEDYYNIVLDACALRPDLQLLEQGDMTEIGEKGINLSGGQRARIALARAVYARADLTLLDDVLAAVDNHVARHIFDKVIGPNGLLGHKARVLVTNSIAYLSQTTDLVLMRSGIILENAPYSAIYTNAQSELYKFITIPSRSESSSGRQSGTTTPKIKEGSSDDSKTETTLVPSPVATSDSKDTRPISRHTKATKSTIIIASPEADKAKKEHRERGRVKTEIYKQYILAGGVGAFFLLACVTALGQAVSIGSTYILKSWAEHNRKAGRNSDMGTYLSLYGAAVFLSSLLSLAVGILLSVVIIIRSTKYMHDRVLQALLRCPLSFFEQTPSGRILNVFSRDVYVLDQVLARVISGALRTGSSVLGTVVVVCVNFPLFTLALVPLGWFYRRIMIYYLATSRELKRLDSTTRAPIFTWFQETLSGLSTIRAFRHQNLFILNLEKRLDRNQMQYMASIDVNRWLAIRLEFIGSLIILLVAVLSLVTLIWLGGIDAGIVGMVLSYCLSVSGALNWMVRSASEVEQNIVSVERMIQYSNLKPEAPMTIEETTPRQPWPSEGAIEFKSLSMRYRPELDTVLKGLNITIPKHSKVGIVGRTGSGKSSTMLVLLRVVEPSEGTILIDGVDITKIGLQDLRNAISIIPQEPELFEGTVRENIDPSGSYDDQVIWTAMEKSGLKEHITLIGGLDATVTEGGSSLSAGQRQLLCFARALLRQTKIILLDEATSAVDPHTDAAIQGIITGPDFQDVTMLTIAHRINTIMDYDYIIVMDAGKIIEYDTPNALLAKKDSAFRSLAAEAKLVDDLE
ncbi:hypothetical protein FRC20_009062 [Serendipita sp. 405]|nr:hypothetical protein FRC20_009062 [Serendipita sp. 405]